MNDKLIQSFATIKNKKEALPILIEFLKKLETQFVNEDNARETVTGPILDAIFDQNDILRKEIECGLVFDFYYRTKIARDFLLSTPEKPKSVWEPQTTKLLLHLAKAGKAKQVLVGGAYFGDQAILVANEINSRNGMLHAFEPNKDQFNMLVHNAELNNIHNIKANNIGLYSNSDTCLKLIGEDSFACAEPVDLIESNEETFKSISIDNYLKEQNIGYNHARY